MNVLTSALIPMYRSQCAGTLALSARAGHNVSIAVATNGNVGSPTHTPEEIGAIRRKEQEASCSLNPPV